MLIQISRHWLETLPSTTQNELAVRLFAQCIWIVLTTCAELSSGSVSIDFTGFFGRKIDDFNRHKDSIEDILWTHNLRSIDHCEHASTHGVRCKH